METWLFIAVVVGLLIFLLWRGRTGSGQGGYVAGGERMDLHEDEANLRMGQFPGPGGPHRGSDGGNVSGGG